MVDIVADGPLYLPPHQFASHRHVDRVYLHTESYVYIYMRVEMR